LIHYDTTILLLLFFNFHLNIELVVLYRYQRSRNVSLDETIDRIGKLLFIYFSLSRHVRIVLGLVRWTGVRIEVFFLNGIEDARID